jgi:hypothetical protein
MLKLQQQIVEDLNIQVDNLVKSSQPKPTEEKNRKNNNRNQRKRTVQWKILIYQPRKTIYKPKPTRVVMPYKNKRIR